MDSKNVLHVKNMVCPRCIKVVAEELERMGLEFLSIQLGRVELKNNLLPSDIPRIKEALEKNGFELLDDKKSMIIEKLKIIIIEGIRDGKFAEMNINLSQYLSDQLHMEYTHLSTLFSSVEGKSIERFMILQKTERVKELITYDEMSIKKISDYLGYSSIQALSSQFKKETGMTPTEFKKLSGAGDRKSIAGL